MTATTGGHRRAGIVSAAHSLPATVRTTAQVRAQIETESGFALPPRLLEQVTGIRERRVVGPGEFSSTLAERAAHAALAGAGREPGEVDLLLFASATRDFIEPATAHVVQHALGSRAHCLDVTNACNSFINGIDLARTMIESGRFHTALVVTGETPSLSTRWRLADPADAAIHFAGYTFGDGGAAVVLEPVRRGGILHTATETYSEHWEVGGVFGGGSRHPWDAEKLCFTGDGREVKAVFEKIGPAIVDATLAAVGLARADLAKVLVHQVTRPYVDRFVEVTGVSPSQLEITIEEYGNLASATLGVQLSRVWNTLRAGDRVLLVGLGGGVSVMTMVWEVS